MNQNTLISFRRPDGVSYQFRITNSNPDVWQRADKSLYLRKRNTVGWVVVDDADTILGAPLHEPHAEKPPEGIWISAKEGKSYLYELTYTVDQHA